MAYEVLDTRDVYRGPIVSLHIDTVRMPDGTTAERNVLEHPGAVMIVALDNRGRVFLLDQYRHPVGGYLTELPAGLLDKPGETPLDAARRELYEEAGLRADTWHTLLDLRISPGGTNEPARVYLARDIHEVPAAERYHLGQGGEGEEADLRTRWVSLREAVYQVLGGSILNASAAAGILAAAAARDRHWMPLRPANLPWMARRLPPPDLTSDAPESFRSAQ